MQNLNLLSHDLSHCRFHPIHTYPSQQALPESYPVPVHETALTSSTYAARLHTFIERGFGQNVYRKQTKLTIKAARKRMVFSIIIVQSRRGSLKSNYLSIN